MRRTTPTIFSRWVIVVGVMLSVLHVFMAASVSKHFSTTFDEVAHLSAGYVYWTDGDFRFQPENGNLPQRIAGLPLLAMDLPPLSAGHPAWKDGNVWELGDYLLYGLGRNPAEILAAARAAIAVVSGGLCLLIFWWSRRLFGDLAGIISVTLAAFSPSLLAHGGLATSDTTTALMFCLTTLAWWRVCHHVTVWTIVFAGITAGLLAVSKFSAALFIPVATLLVLVRLSRRLPLTVGFRRSSWKVRGWFRLPVFVAVAAMAVGLAWGTIWGFFGFRFQPSVNPKHTSYARTWDSLFLKSIPPVPPLTDERSSAESLPNFQPGIIQSFAHLSLKYHLFPEPYIHGFLIVDRYSRSRSAFFAGEFRSTGWWTFFPTAFLVKTSLPALILIAAGVGAILYRIQRSPIIYRLSPLWTLGGVYGAAILTANLNIGHRHMLPLYPILFVLAGGIVRIKPQRNWISFSVGLILVWQVFVSLGARPYYLAYFNPLGGGSKNAYKLFVDSSLDWGQDLPGLATFLKSTAHPKPVYLSYFGTGSPQHEGIEATRIGDAYFDANPRNIPVKISGGTFAISATMFQRIYTSTRGPWTPKLEATFTTLKGWLPIYFSHQSDDDLIGPYGKPIDNDELTALLWNYEDLLFARLCYFLKHFEPDTQIGYSILIYYLSAEEISQIKYGSLHELNDAIEVRLR